MGEAASGTPSLLIGLPESLGRRMRLGPFPSARRALKFAAYATVGGAVAAVGGAIWTVPFLGAGFLLSVHHPDGRALDEQASEYLQFRWRARPGRRVAPRRPVDPGHEEPYVTSGSGHLIGVLSVGGLPIAFLPPAEARALFDAYRELLRSLERGLVLQFSVEPIPERPYLPPGHPPATGGPVEAARTGYREMVTLLCRRRYRRRVLLAAWEPPGPDGAVRLERELERLGVQLGRLGLAPVRLRGARLRAAAQHIGWRTEGLT